MEPIIQMFVLLGFLSMAFTFFVWGGRRHVWFGGAAVVFFAVALVLHLVGMVSP